MLVLVISCSCYLSASFQYPLELTNLFSLARLQCIILSSPSGISNFSRTLKSMTREDPPPFILWELQPHFLKLLWHIIKDSQGSLHRYIPHLLLLLAFQLHPLRTLGCCCCGTRTLPLQFGLPLLWLLQPISWGPASTSCSEGRVLTHPSLAFQSAILGPSCFPGRTLIYPAL